LYLLRESFTLPSSKVAVAHGQRSDDLCIHNLGADLINPQYFHPNNTINRHKIAPKSKSTKRVGSLLLTGTLGLYEIDRSAG